MEPNWAPSDAGSTLNGSTYPKWKMSRFVKWNIFLVWLKTQQVIIEYQDAANGVLVVITWVVIVDHVQT